MIARHSARLTARLHHRASHLFHHARPAIHAAPNPEPQLGGPLMRRKAGDLVHRDQRPNVTGRGRLLICGTASWRPIRIAHGQAEDRGLDVFRHARLLVSLVTGCIAADWHGGAPVQYRPRTRISTR